MVGSTIAREVDGGIYLHAGPEIGVASTKAFTSQVAALALVTAPHRPAPEPEHPPGPRVHPGAPGAAGPDRRRSWSATAEIEQLAERFLGTATNSLYLGRGFNFPVALEGALKLKEISYIHAEGYPAAEMKHGPIALIDENMPVVFIAPQDAVHSKIVSNIEEVKARGGKVIALINEGDTEIERLADATFTIPETLDLLTPILTSIPLQLLVLLRRGGPRVQRGPAAEPGQVGDGGVAGEMITPPRPTVLGTYLAGPRASSRAGAFSTPMTSPSRRDFLRRTAGMAGAAILAPSLAGLVLRSRAPLGSGPPSPLLRAGLGAGGYGPLRAAGPELALPEGFAYSVLSSIGKPMSDGHPTPCAFDGMARVRRSPTATCA